ncbi:unnamed protein product [Rotaria sordida]|uniref:Uncharacterized protein n=1 Tax=Rotaria sordida TaxID=392033 RepID=A0A814P1M2_9BILA|nr:unnamed protein product [Rotaria sordida]CAF1198211.1 unnamed protein product [Rotaria sordida]
MQAFLNNTHIMYRLLTISFFVAAILFVQIACDDDDDNEDSSFDLEESHHKALYDGSCAALVATKANKGRDNCYQVVHKLDWYGV